MEVGGDFWLWQHAATRRGAPVRGTRGSAPGSVAGVSAGRPMQGLLIGYAAFAGALYRLDVLVKSPAGELVGRLLPMLLAGRQFGVREGDVDFVRLGVNRDRVAVLQQCDRAANLGFRGYMANEETVRAAGEPSVRHEGDLVPQAGSHEGGRRREHLGHAGAALRAFITDDDHLAPLDLPLLQTAQHLFFAVVAERGTGERQPLLAGNFGDRSGGRDIASHD